MPNDVYYMAFGVQLTRATKNEQCGVIPNFTMFSGEELLQKIGIIKASESQKFKKFYSLQYRRHRTYD
jgi:hypothetical protein